MPAGEENEIASADANSIVLEPRRKTWVVIRTGPVVAYRIAIGFFGAGLLLFLAFYFLRPASFVAELGALNGKGGDENFTVVFQGGVEDITQALARVGVGTFVHAHDANQ